MTIYYINNVTGDDTNNSGTAISEPFLTVKNLLTATVNAGDQVLFARTGKAYTGYINMTRSGSSGNNIIIGSYGADNDDKAVLTNPTQANASGNILIFDCNASYVTFQDLEFRDTLYACIIQYQTKTGMVIRRCRFARAGMGTRHKSGGFLIEDCEYTDIDVMARDVGDSADYGGVGVSLEALSGSALSSYTIRNNRFIRCRAKSNIAGGPYVDGGAIEFYEGSTGGQIYNNHCEDCTGFAELGGTSLSNIIADTDIYNNVIVRPFGKALYFNDPAGSFKVGVSNLRFYHNTVIATDRAAVTPIYFQGAWGSLASVFTMEDNIICGGAVELVKMGSGDANIGTMVHRNNIFRRSDGSSSIGMTLGTGELTSDPSFAAPLSDNYTLAAGSPAIGAGSTVGGYSTDHEGLSVNVPADIGAHQYKAPAAVANAKQQTAKLTPINDYSNYGITESNYIEGGLHHGSRISQRNRIPTNRRRAGMIFALGSKHYYLGDDLVTWHLLRPEEQNPKEIPIAQILYDASSGTAGGSGTVDTQVVRPLNLIRVNFSTADPRLTDVSLDTGTSQFTLPDGVYYIEAIMVSNKTNATRAQIYNNTDSTVVGRSLPGWAPNNADTNMPLTIPPTRVVVSGPKALSIRQIVDQVDGTTPTFEFGRPVGAVTGGDGASEMYTFVHIQKVR